MMQRVQDLPHIGPVLASRILHKFGGPERSHLLALQTIQTNPDELLDVKGISSKMIPDIIRAIQPLKPHSELTADDHAYDKLLSLDFNDRQTNLIVKHLGSTPNKHEHEDEDPAPPSPALAWNTIQQNPYNLLEVPGLTYKQVDTVARDLFNIPPDDFERNFHANQYILRRNNGVMGQSRFQDAREQQGLPPVHQSAGVILEFGRAWLPEEHEAERHIAEWLQHKLRSKLEHENITARDSKVMDHYNLNEQQRSLIETVLTNPVCILTGGAGTGKTFTVAALIDLAHRKSMNVHVLTLAGKSAERVAQVCRKYDIPITEGNQYGTTIDEDREITTQGLIYITTVHRGLRSDKGGTFNIRQLAADLIIIDEASMIPNALLAAILERARPNARFLFAGDPAQLPPITYGAPFDDFIKFGRVPHVDLTQNYRQAAQESIHMFATAIRERQPMPFLSAPGLQLHFQTQVHDAPNIIINHLEANPQSLLNWQVITSTNKIRADLNQALQQQLNPDSERIAIVQDQGSTVLKAGDKIVVTRNDYESGIMNGQTGIMIGKGATQDTALVSIENVELELPMDTIIKAIRLGYAITVHKAQGSGWPTVFSVEQQPRGFTINRLHYTAITRAERFMAFITTLDRDTWWSTLTAAEHKRTSSLERRLTRRGNP